MVRDSVAQRSQWRAYKKPPPLFRVIRSLSPPPPSNEVPSEHPGPTSRRVLPPGEYARRYRQGSNVLCAGCYYESSDVAFCQINYFGPAFPFSFPSSLLYISPILPSENRYFPLSRGIALAAVCTQLICYTARPPTRPVNHAAITHYVVQ